jgi:1,2-diacylglycerol 3-alpha-glucosyltransferase
LNIGIFTDTYFPQVSGVATSIKTLKEQLERNGHQVYIFTTTDPHVDKKHYEENIFRFSSIPFISFTDRRIAIRGMFQAYQIAKKLNLDIIHTQTEFSMGIIGKVVSRFLGIPCIHTYHTMYEDYLHYVANGKILRPVHVKEATLAFCHNMSGIVAPSKKVLDTLVHYGVKSPIRVIPTGINVNKFRSTSHFDIRKQLGFAADTPILLSVSRLAYEKNIKELVSSMLTILKVEPKAKLVIVGDGPARDDLVNQVQQLQLTNSIKFVGEVNNDEVYKYYHSANLFVSTSNSESQGLTYIEAMAAGVKVVVSSSPYTEDLLSSKVLGTTFSDEDGYVRSVLDYLLTPQRVESKAEEKIRLDKLHEISSEHFADQIVNFYKSVQLEHNKSMDNSDEISN